QVRSNAATDEHRWTQIRAKTHTGVEAKTEATPRPRPRQRTKQKGAERRMSTKPKILAFAGSLREGAFNHKAVSLAVKSAEQHGADVTLIRLRDYPLPIYDADLEAKSGLPEHAVRLKRLFWDHHGLLISSPEYNSSLSGALKNTIDWVSRPGG